MSERVPLGAVPSCQIPPAGDELLMGRSSNSSHYQLSSNRLISRVHVRAVYRPATEEHEDGEVLIECLGWNGVKVHCRGRMYELGKGDTFRSDRPQADIMLDVQDARVLVKWPVARRHTSVSPVSDAWDRGEPVRRPMTPAEHFPSSPPMLPVHLQSPVSPSPRRPDFDTRTTFIGLPPSSSPAPEVEVYEDHPSEDEEPALIKVESPKVESPAAVPDTIAAIASSPLSEPEDDFSDEENEPLVHALGPFGANILPRMATMTATGSPERSRQPLKTSTQPKIVLKSSRKPSFSDVRNHVVNQLAYSRVHSLPMSTILNNLPASMKEGNDSPAHVENPPRRAFTDADLEELLLEIPCIGQIAREGKDAAGKPLEDEFYYVPDMDSDEMRRSAVEGGLRKTSLRAVRKQHKVSVNGCNLTRALSLFDAQQYYWKRPRF